MANNNVVKDNMSKIKTIPKITLHELDGYSVVIEVCRCCQRLDQTIKAMLDTSVTAMTEVIAQAIGIST